jgi:hypothetical protein
MPPKPYYRVALQASLALSYAGDILSFRKCATSQTTLLSWPRGRASPAHSYTVTPSRVHGNSPLRLVRLVTEGSKLLSVLSAYELVEIALFPVGGLILVGERELALIEFLEEFVPADRLKGFIVAAWRARELQANHASVTMSPGPLTHAGFAPRSSRQTTRPFAAGLP